MSKGAVKLLWAVAIGCGVVALIYYLYTWYMEHDSVYAKNVQTAKANLSSGFSSVANSVSAVLNQGQALIKTGLAGGLANDMTTGYNYLFNFLPTSLPSGASVATQSMFYYYKNNSNLPITSQNFLNLADEFYQNIKTNLQRYISLSDAQNVTGQINTLAVKVQTLGGSAPQITYTDAASGLVFWDIVVRQTLIEEHYNYFMSLPNAIAADNLFKFPGGKPVTGYVLHSEVGAHQLLSGVLVNMGNDTSGAAVYTDEALCYEILAFYQGSIDPSGAELAADAASNANDLKTFVTIAMTVISFV